MKTKINWLVLLVVGVVGMLLTGCGSYGGSYQTSHHNYLANGKTVACNSNGVPMAPINGEETYEHHSSYELNPFAPILKVTGVILGGLCHPVVNDEVVVVPVGYYQAPVIYRPESRPVYGYPPVTYLPPYPKPPCNYGYGNRGGQSLGGQQRPH